jgi:hypothetical protein
LFAVLLTANFQGNAEAEFSALSELQPGRPSWAMEMWTGWFDHWLATPHESRPKESMHTLIYQIKKNLYHQKDLDNAVIYVTSQLSVFGGHL